MPITRRTKVYIAIDSEESDEFRAYCRYCRVVKHELNLLIPLIIEEGEERPSDYDKWKQCSKCERKEKTEEARQEGELYTDIEINVSDEVETVHKKGRLEEIRDREEKIDPDVKKAIKRGETVLNYAEYQLE